MNKLGTESQPQDKALFSGDSYMTEEVEREAVAARDRVFAEIERLNLQAAVGDLDMHGYTVLPPEQVSARWNLLNVSAAHCWMLRKRTHASVPISRPARPTRDTCRGTDSCNWSSP